MTPTFTSIVYMYRFATLTPSCIEFWLCACVDISWVYTCVICMQKVCVSMWKRKRVVTKVCLWNKYQECCCMLKIQVCVLKVRDCVCLHTFPLYKRVSCIDVHVFSISVHVFSIWYALFNVPVRVYVRLQSKHFGWFRGSFSFTYHYQALCLCSFTCKVFRTPNRMSCTLVNG